MRFQKKTNIMRHYLTLAFFLMLAMNCVAHNVVEEDGRYVVTHEWKCGDRQWNCTINVPVELYAYYQGRVHTSDDMVHFVLSDYHKNAVRDLVASFREGGKKAGYTDTDNMRNVISFVQSLRYVADQDSKGEKDYVRFPIETLVDGEGDCEDMAILTAVILHEMGYKVMLVILPDHLALAVACDEEVEGTYYKYEGSNYYYLEVTSTGWNLGQIPDEFRGKSAKLVPLLYQPRLYLKRCSYRHDSYYSSAREVPYIIQCEVENAGPGLTEGLSVHVIFKTGKDSRKAFVDRVFNLNELREGESATYELSVPVPRPMKGALEVRLEGANFNEDSMLFEDVELE